MRLYEEIERIKAEGYSEDNARAKLGQDIVLKAISESGMGRNTTIKGGVVMRSISGNSRRATQDFDLDFIRYSILDDSVQRFIRKLNCIEGLNIEVIGKIIPLNHQDYKGKRVFIAITDTEGTVLSLKMDIGIHNDLSVEQEEYAFDVGFQKDVVSLLINSPAQMIAEKLKSLVRFGTRNTRYKDVFDICFLSERADIDQLNDCIRKYIFADPTLSRVSSIQDIYSRVEKTFSNPGYLKEVEKSRLNWLDISISEVLERDLSFIKSLER